jgi:hypothetical protein
MMMFQRVLTYAVSLFLAAACLLLPGCAFLEGGDPDYEDPKPWNSPAGWEHNTLGVPM